MKSIKSLVARIVLCVTITFSATAANAGIPVIDIAALIQDAMQKANGRIAQIQSLMKQVSASPDAKSAQELQSRIEAETALLQHEQSQIALARGVADADYRIAESQAREAQMQQASRTKRLADFIPK